MFLKISQSNVSTITPIATYLHHCAKPHWYLFPAPYDQEQFAAIEEPHVGDPGDSVKNTL